MDNYLNGNCKCVNFYTKLYQLLNVVRIVNFYIYLAERHGIRKFEHIITKRVEDGNLISLAELESQFNIYHP